MNAKQILSKLVADLSLQVAETQEALDAAYNKIQELEQELEQARKVNTSS